MNRSKARFSSSKNLRARDRANASMRRAKDRLQKQQLKSEIDAQAVVVGQPVPVIMQADWEELVRLGVTVVWVEGSFARKQRIAPFAIVESVIFDHASSEPASELSSTSSS